MQSIDEQLARLTRRDPPPEGLYWKYRTKSTVIGPADMVCLSL